MAMASDLEDLTQLSFLLCHIVASPWSLIFTINYNAMNIIIKQNFQTQFDFPIVREI